MICLTQPSRCLPSDNVCGRGEVCEGGGEVNDVVCVRSNPQPSPKGKLSEQQLSYVGKLPYRVLRALSSNNRKVKGNTLSHKTHANAH